MADFLVEIGTEELPPKALMNLANAFHDHIASGFRNNTFGFGKTKVFATPRRIAVLLENLAVEVDRRKNCPDPKKVFFRNL